MTTNCFLAAKKTIKKERKVKDNQSKEGTSKQINSDLDFC